MVGVLRFISFGILGAHPVPIWCDNEVCIMVAKDASSIKRLAYVTRRVRLLQELEAREIVKMPQPGVPGTANPADALTKHLKDKQSWREYMAVLYNVDVSYI